MRVDRAFVLAAALGLAACVPDMKSAPVVANSQIHLGQVAYVACRDMPVHAQPSGYSPVLGQVPYGATVTALEFAGLYQMPESQQDKTADANRTISAAKAQGAAWVKVQSGNATGYAANSCLIDKSLMDRQDPKGQAKSAGTQATRRFTEDERGDQRVNRGGLGVAAACTGANCLNLDAVDKLVQATPPANPFVDDAAFRQAGRLGEFK